MPYSDGKPSVLLLLSVTLSGIMAINLYAPSMPDIARAFATSGSNVQLTVLVFLVAFAVAQLVYGPLSDRYGRRPVLLSGLLLFVLANIVCAVAFSIEFLMTARVFQAVGACSGSVMTRAIVRDAYGREEAAKVMGYLAVGIGVAAAISPSIGGLIQGTVGWRGGFVFHAVLAGFPVLVAWRMLKETHLNRDPLTGGGLRMFSNFAVLLRSPLFLGYTFSVAFINGSFFAFLAAAPFILVDSLGQPPKKVGLFLLYSTGGFLIGSLIGPRIIGRVGLDRVIVFGAINIFVVVAIMAAIGLSGHLSVNAIMFPMFLTGISGGFVFPPAVAAAVGVIPRMSGSASGLLGFMQLGMGAIGTGLASLFGHETQVPVALTMAAMATGGLGSLWLIRWGRRLLPDA